MATAHKLPPSIFKRLCTIQRHLHRWAEEECNGTIQWDDDDCTIPRRYYLDRYGCATIRGPIIPNKEAKYLKEAATLAAQCGGLIYHQTDPRGCSLYFYRSIDLVGRKFPIDQIYNSVAIPLIP